jgi:hypothetical protein
VVGTLQDGISLVKLGLLQFQQMQMLLLLLQDPKQVTEVGLIGPDFVSTWPQEKAGKLQVRGWTVLCFARTCNLASWLVSMFHTGALQAWSPTAVAVLKLSLCTQFASHVLCWAVLKYVTACCICYVCC